jgi:hypothetical protein
MTEASSCSQCCVGVPNIIKTHELQKVTVFTRAALLEEQLVNLS